MFFQFNRNLTTLSLNSIQALVDDVVDTYFGDTVGEFDQAFRRSNLLTEIDNVSPAVLSSRLDIKMQQRIIPTAGRALDFNLRFAVPIAEPDDVNYIITSTTFIHNGKTCIIRNRLSSTKLEIIGVSDSVVYVDNIGSYSTTGTLSLVGFNPDSIIGGVNFIKISVIPANQSSIVPQRNDIITYDSGPSFTSGIVTTST